MPEQKPPFYCELLQQWQVSRELANYYITALLRLKPDTPGALQRRQELNEKISLARLRFRQIDDQLRAALE
jgi:hypothetical protein